MEQLNDSELVELYISGNDRAFEEILKRHSREIKKTILNLTKDNNLMEEIYSEFLYHFITRIKNGKYKETGQFLGWAATMARNLCYDYFRTKKRSKIKRLFNVNDSIDEIDERLFELPPNNDPTEIRNVLDTMISKLIPDLQSVVRMHYFEGYKFREIAKEHGSTTSTELGRCRYALINLRKMIANHKIALR